MLISFTTLAFLLFGCSSPSNGVVAANNVAVAVAAGGGVQEDNEIDDFARKVNSPTAGVSFSDSDDMLMDHHQRVLKEGKGKNQRQAMKNEEGRRALGLFDSKSPKVAPGGLDQAVRLYAAQVAIKAGDFPAALQHTLSLLTKSGEQSLTETEMTAFEATIAGSLVTTTQRLYTYYVADDDGDDGKESFKAMQMDYILTDMRKTYRSVTKTIDAVIDNAYVGQKVRFFQAQGDVNYAIAFQSLLAGHMPDDKNVKAALVGAEGAYRRAYQSCSDCLEPALRIAHFLESVHRQDEADEIVQAQLNQLSGLVYAIILLEGRRNAYLKNILSAPILESNLNQVVDVATCSHFATFTVYSPCDDSCDAWPYDKDSLEQGQDEGEKECCGMAYKLACAMKDEIIAEKGDGHDIEVQVALNNVLNEEGEIDSTTVSEINLKVVTSFDNNDFVPSQIEAPPDEQDVSYIASNAIQSITSPVTITLEDDYEYEFSICQESPFHSNTMVVSLVGTNTLIDSDKIYFQIGGTIGGKLCCGGVLLP